MSKTRTSDHHQRTQHTLQLFPVLHATFFPSPGALTVCSVVLLSPLDSPADFHAASKGQHRLNLVATRASARARVGVAEEPEWRPTDLAPAALHAS